MASVIFRIVLICAGGWAAFLTAVATPQWQPRSAVDTVLNAGSAQLVRADLEPVSSIGWYKNELLLGYSDRNKILYKDEKPGNGSVIPLERYIDTLEPGQSSGPGCIIPYAADLIVCDGPGRRVLGPQKTPLVAGYGDRRFNGPVAAVLADTNLYFADAPSQTEGGRLFRYEMSGRRRVTLESRQVRRPAGLAVDRVSKRLYVSEADPDRPGWLVFDIEADGSLGPGTVFVDARTIAGSWQGIPGAIAVDEKHNVITAGPGGVHVYDSNGVLVQVLQTREAVNALLLGRGDLYYVEGPRLVRISRK